MKKHLVNSVCVVGALYIGPYLLSMIMGVFLSFDPLMIFKERNSFNFDFVHFVSALLATIGSVVYAIILFCEVSDKMKSNKLLKGN